MIDHQARLRVKPENHLMSLAEHVSRPFPVLTKLAVMLRMMPAMQFVLAKFAVLLGRDRASGERPDSEILAEAPAVTGSAFDPPAPLLQSSGAEPVLESRPEDPSGREALVPDRMMETAVELPVSEFRDVVAAAPESAADPDLATLPSSSAAVVAAPRPADPSNREALIRQRWMETGIKMWNADLNGSRRAALNIQGRVGLLPLKPGQLLPRYDTLEFKQIEDRIVCEGVVVEPPKRRT